MQHEDEIELRKQSERALSEYRDRLEKMVRASTEQALQIQKLLHETRRSEQALRESEARSREQAEHLKVLIAELSHRVKNTLATLQGIVTQTLRHTSTPEEFATALTGRLRMLAAAHAVLTRSEWKGASMTEVVESTMKVYPQFATGRIHIQGPAVELPASHVLSLSMLLHELATNALKHGALINSSGVVDICWSVNHQHLDINWRESGGPAVSHPTHQGFGTGFIKRLASFELLGTCDLSFDPEGIACSITFDLPLAPSCPPPPPVTAAAA